MWAVAHERKMKGFNPLNWKREWRSSSKVHESERELERVAAAQHIEEREIDRRAVLQKCSVSVDFSVCYSCQQTGNISIFLPVFCLLYCCARVPIVGFVDLISTLHGEDYICSVDPWWFQEDLWCTPLIY